MRYKFERLKSQIKKKIYASYYRSKEDASHRMPTVLPLLCECTKCDGYVEHKSQCNTYVLWVLPDGQHIAFMHLHLICSKITNKGQTFGELLLTKQSHEEACKMISRPFLQALGYKPDYTVIVSNEPTSDDDCRGYYYYSTMPAILQLCAKNPTMQHIRTLVEGPGEPCGPNNQIGQTLTQLSLRLASRGFFADPKYFPSATRDMRCLAMGMDLNELRIRKLLKLV